MNRQEQMNEFKANRAAAALRESQERDRTLFALPPSPSIPVMLRG